MHIVNQDTIANIVWVLYKQEDARSEELSYSGGKSETEGSDLSSNSEEIFGKAITEEGSCLHVSK
jgi:hypothetical protein